MSHRCPGPECGNHVPSRLLACRAHWAQVPGALKRAVYAAWRAGEGAYSEEHQAAMEAAIASMRPLRRRP